jgi:CheY-like chemotaxis protein
MFMVLHMLEPTRRPIIVLEDDAVLRAELVAWIGGWGWRALALDATLGLPQSGDHLYAAAVVADFDLGLTVPGMPPRTGLDIALSIARRMGKPVPTVILSGSYGRLELAACSRHQIPVLFKPVQPNELHHWLMQAVPLLRA